MLLFILFTKIKKMKKNKLFLTALAGTCFALTLVSCKKSGCTDSTASNFNAEAKKDDGSCKKSTVDSRDQLVGNYLVTDSLFSSGVFVEEKVYVLQINKGDTKKDTIYINNFWNGGGSLEAINAGPNFSIPSQSGVSGLGKVTGSTITFDIADGGADHKGTGTKY